MSADHHHDRPTTHAASVDPTRLVFIGGLHRSGTTPLARCLGSHPEVSGLTSTGVEEDEGQHLQRILPTGEAFGGPGSFARDQRAHMTEDDPRANPRTADHLIESWSPYWDLSRRLLLEKSPPNIVRARLLQSLFPGCRFIFVVRHPVVVSLSTKKWAPRTTYSQLMENWFAAHDTMLNDATHLANMLVLRYESLVAEPEGELARVASFLGVAHPFDSDFLRAGRSSIYADEWDRWRDSHGWPRVRRWILTKRFRERVERYGYDMNRLDITNRRWPGAELTAPWSSVSR